MNPAHSTMTTFLESSRFSNTSYATNNHISKRRVIFAILSICLTISRASLAATESEIDSQDPSHQGNSTIRPGKKDCNGAFCYCSKAIIYRG